jgi:integrase/recombinase XerD
MNSTYFQLWEKHSPLADTTKKSYVYKLQQLEQFIIECGFEGETVDFDSFYSDTDEPIDKYFIDDFIENESGRISKSSLYITICALSHFFGFLFDLKLIKKNPMLHYPNPNYSLNKKDRSLSNEDCKKLLIASLKIDPFFKQYAVLFLLGITCGLRAKEIISLKRDQINFDRNSIFVYNGKNSKSIAVHMPTSTKKALYDYVNHPHWINWGNGNKQKEVFFFEESVLTYTNLRKMLDQISKTAQMDINITPHQMRHTMARMMFEKNIHLSIIQRQLRHKNVRTTIHYLPPCPELVQIINQNMDEFGIDFDN